MADATQELMLRVRGDNSGVDKATAGTEKAVKRLSVSAEKAKGAFQNFSRSLSEARDASDVAASAASSLGHIIGKSLVGAVAVGAVKIFTDQISRMGEMLRETATAAQKSFNDIEKAGQAMSLAEAMAQTSAIEANISAINNQIAELNRSPFQNFIAQATGAKGELEALVKTNQRLRDAKLAEGMVSENANEAIMEGLDAEEKKLRDIDNQYRNRQKQAQGMTEAGPRQSFIEGAGESMVRQRNAVLNKQAKDRAESQKKFDIMVFDAEQKLATQAAEREKRTEQERTERKIANNNRIYSAERYNIDEASKMEQNADNTRFQRLLRDANRAREQQKRTEATGVGTSGGVLEASRAGQQALDVARKQRERQLKKENFEVAERVAPTQRDREKLAAQQVAGETPSLGERIQGGLSGVDPSEIARQAAATKFEKDRAVAQARGSGVVGRLGEGQSSLSKETLQAIKALVDMMKSGTVVQ